jgi:tyrosyl-tRNA synthetase
MPPFSSLKKGARFFDKSFFLFRSLFSILLPIAFERTLFMNSAYDTLSERGFIAQLSHENEIKELLKNKKVVFYAGFDPTADSLHAGSLLPIMAMSHLQRAGHKPIALVGGATAMVADPTGKDEMRAMLSTGAIDANIVKIKAQLSCFLDFGQGGAIMVNNADWIRPLNYVEFLREIGVHFSVNRMLTAECFRQRMEKGLTFYEFNYMLLQAYDFLILNRKYGCVLQVGGDDQWSNILAGADLIRRKDQKEAFGMTFNLITTSGGKKMGKTEKGAVWLDPAKTPPYEYFQYWRNVEDESVVKFLNFFTYLETAEILKLSKLKGEELNEAKKVLAFEATKIVHGKEEAEKAKKAAESLFEGGGDAGSIPVTEFPLNAGTTVLDLFLAAKLISSKSEGRKLIAQAGLSVNDEAVKSHGMPATQSLVNEKGVIVLKKGKKSYHYIKVV